MLDESKDDSADGEEGRGADRRHSSWLSPKVLMRLANDRRHNM